MEKLRLLSTIAIVFVVLVFVAGLFAGIQQLYFIAAGLGALWTIMQLWNYSRNHYIDLRKNWQRRKLSKDPASFHRVAELVEKDWNKITGNGIDTIKRILTYYHDAQSGCLPELSDLSRNIAKQIEERNLAGDHSIWNGDRLRLTDFAEGRIGRDEDYELTLRFENSRYSDFLATKKYLDQTRKASGARVTNREYYVKNTDPKMNVVSDLVSDFGISLLVLTSDNKLLFTKRKGKVEVSPYAIHLSCHEGLARPRDLDEQRRVDIDNAALRALREEVFITDISPQHISWILFGHDKVTWEYNLHGIVRVNKTWAEVSDRFDTLARDRNLEHDLYSPPVDADLKSIMIFLTREWDALHHLAKNAIFYSLVNLTMQWDDVLQAFREFAENRDKKNL